MGARPWLANTQSNYARMLHTETVEAIVKRARGPARRARRDLPGPRHGEPRGGDRRACWGGGLHRL